MRVHGWLVLIRLFIRTGLLVTMECNSSDADVRGDNEDQEGGPDGEVIM